MTESNAIAPTLSPSARGGIMAYLGISAVVLLLLMLFGLLMRVGQAQWLQVPPDLFYQLMTAHGAGMVGISGLAGSAVLWYFLNKQVKLHVGILWINLALFLLGVVLILGGIFLGGFAGGWTFLYPLPSHGMGLWGVAGAASYMLGLLSIGVGFLLFYLDAGRAIISRYGSFSRSLGWPQLFSGRDLQTPPPASVVAGTMVVIVNTLGILGGAVILVLMLTNLFFPAFPLDALLAKNLIYFFGHVFINATIYQAVIAVYEILPKYTNRPWKVNRVFLAAWTASTLMVVTVYPHHLLMDFAMPAWALVAGQVISYMSGFPILVVTAYGALTLVSRSGIRWDVTCGLLFLSMFGWAAGVIPSIIDATISVNQVMHNTMWVPGHFHFYLILGLVAMLFGFMYYFTQRDGTNSSQLDTAAFWAFAGGGLGFVMMFLAGGYEGVPRRWAVHFPEWLELDKAASLFAALLVLGTVVLALRFLFSLKEARVS